MNKNLRLSKHSARTAPNKNIKPHHIMKKVKVINSIKDRIEFNGMKFNLYAMPTGPQTSNRVDAKTNRAKTLKSSIDKITDAMTNVAAAFDASGMTLKEATEAMQRFKQNPIVKVEHKTKDFGFKDLKTDTRRGATVKQQKREHIGRYWINSHMSTAAHCVEWGVIVTPEVEAIIDTQSRTSAVIDFDKILKS